ncbi:MAG: SCP2 sterol-binding domain-containing protein [Pseudomonadota bacterium]|nr:SCP2 sterol-binding domain-containing protein [Pseudomonadota bacterium]
MGGNDTLPLAVLEAVLNRALAGSSAAARLCQELNGRVLQVELTDLGRQFFLVATPGGIQLLREHPQPADAQLRGSSLALLRAGRDADTSRLFAGELALTGETQVAEGFQRLLALARPDPEAVLAQVLPGPLAHGISHRARRFGSWLTQAGRTLAEDTGEYLRHEAALVPATPAVADFTAEVDTLRDDIARLQARLDRLTPPPDQD